MCGVAYLSRTAVVIVNRTPPPQPLPTYQSKAIHALITWSLDFSAARNLHDIALEFSSCLKCSFLYFQAETAIAVMTPYKKRSSDHYPSSSPCKENDLLKRKISTKLQSTARQAYIQLSTYTEWTFLRVQYSFYKIPCQDGSPVLLSVSQACAVREPVLVAAAIPARSHQYFPVFSATGMLLSRSVFSVS